MIKQAKNGDVEVDDDYANRGQEITVTVTPDKGYKLDELVILDADGNEVDYEKGRKDNTFVFEMPKSDVTIEASFEKAKDSNSSDKVEKEDKEQNEKPAVKDDTTIVLTIGSTAVTVDGEKVANDVAPMIKGDRKFLPVRFIAENLGAEVDWNNADKTVTIIG